MSISRECRKYSVTKVAYPNQLFLKDLRVLKENTEILFCKSYHDELEKEKRQFVRVKLTKQFISIKSVSTWAIVTRDINGDIKTNPLRGWGAVRSVGYNGWRRDRWIALNTEEITNE